MSHPASRLPARDLVVAAREYAQEVSRFTSSKFGQIGVYCKGVVARALRFYIVQQDEFNQRVIRALDELLESVTETTDTTHAQGKQLDELAGHIAALACDVDTIRDDGAELRQQVAGMDEIRTAIAPLAPSLDSLREEVAALRNERAVLYQRVDGLASLSAEVASLRIGIDGQAMTAVRLDEQEKRLSDLLETQEHDLSRLRGEVAQRFEVVVKDVVELRRQLGDRLDPRMDELATSVADVNATLSSRIPAALAEFGDRVGRVEARTNGRLAFDHFGFCRRFRGEEDVIKERMKRYVPVFGDVSNILDLGCGRGEFLDACRDGGIGAYGIDLDPDMISHCQLKKLDVRCEDAIEHLQSLPDRSLDGLFSAQMVEHLIPQEICELLRLGAKKLKRGAWVVIETLNADTLASLRWFFLDPTHHTLIPHETLQFLLEDAGFVVHDILPANPVQDGQRLATFPTSAPTQQNGETDLVLAHNENCIKLNDRLFGEQDYAIIAER